MHSKRGRAKGGVIIKMRIILTQSVNQFTLADQGPQFLGVELSTKRLVEEIDRLSRSKYMID